MVKGSNRQNSSQYFEKHHIIPKCLGGSDDSSNLVKLTPEEHYLAHLLLMKINPGVYALSYSAFMMTRANSQMVRSNKMYGWLKRKFSEDLSRFQKERFEDKTKHPCFGKFGKDHPRFGIPHSEESKLRIAEANRGKTMKTETKAKMSLTMKTVYSSPEYKLRIGLSRKTAFAGEKNPAYGTVLINNGVIRKRVAKGQPIPDGWTLGGLLAK